MVALLPAKDLIVFCRCQACGKGSEWEIDCSNLVAEEFKIELSCRHCNQPTEIMGFRGNETQS